jgi:nucleoside-diphosphate-sugar epimerase
MTDLYVYLLELPHEKIHKKIWNLGYQNYTVRQIAEIVRGVIEPNLSIKTVPTNDNRSYHVSSRKIAQDINFVAKHSIEEAVNDLKDAFNLGLIPNPMDDVRYYNIKMMQSIRLK